MITTAELAKGFDDSGNFLLFLDHVFSLGFYDEPDYDLLTSSLEKCLKNINAEYDIEYDWNKRWV